MNKVILSIASSFLLIGCDTFKRQPEVITRTVTEYVYIDIPKEFTDKRVTPRPILDSEYLKLSHDEREYVLVMYSNSLLAEIATRDSVTAKLLNWSTEQKNIINKPKQKE